MTESGRGRDRRYGEPWGRGHRGRDRGSLDGRTGAPGIGFDGQPARCNSRMARGDVRTAILALLTEQPRHGYQLIQQIRERSDGLWRPSAGSVYPALKQLSAEGLLQAEHSGGRRVFHLTEDGARYAADRDEELAAVWDAAGARLDNGIREFRALGAQVLMAVTQVSEAGTPRQLARAQEILTCRQGASVKPR